MTTAAMSSMETSAIVSRIDVEAGELIVAFEEREVAYGLGELDEVVLAL